MSNVLSEEKKQQVIALGRLGWSLRRIQRETHIRRETAASYLKAAGIATRPPGGWGHRAPAKPAIQVITGFGTASAEQKVVPGRSPSASASEPYRELIEMGFSAAVMREPSGRIWSTATASLPEVRASGATFANCTEQKRRKRAR